MFIYLFITTYTLVLLAHRNFLNYSYMYIKTEKFDNIQLYRRRYKQLIIFFLSIRYTRNMSPAIPNKRTYLYRNTRYEQIHK